MIEAAVIAHLKAASGVAALIGTRVYSVLAKPNAERPYLINQVISSTDDHHSAGPGLTIRRIQIDAWGDTYEQVKPLGEAVIAVMDGFRGDMQGVEMLYISLLNTQDLFDAAAERFRVSTDFRLRARI